MARGVDGMMIYRDDSDRQYFLKLMNRVVRESNATVLAYCLMGNHFHVVVKTTIVSLSVIIQRILTGYALTFNKKYSRRGHLFQERHKSVFCRDDKQLLCQIRYVEMNPVRAGLVEKPEDWRWASHSPNKLPVLEEGFDPWANNEPRPVLIRPPREHISSIDEIARTLEMDHRLLRARIKTREIVAARCRLTLEAVQRGYGIQQIADWLQTGRQSVSYYLRTNSTNLSA